MDERANNSVERHVDGEPVVSRAFVKDSDDMPERPVALEPATEPAPITARGRARLEAALAKAQSQAERQRLTNRLEVVYVVPPPEDRSAVGFGATVTVAGIPPGHRSFTIAGDDEVDIPSGSIGPDSPLAQALLGARAGDTVIWHRPAGELALTIQKIEYE